MTSLFSVTFDTSFRTKEESAEELSPPSGFCLTPDGNFLLADDFNHRLQVYDSQFNLINSFGEKGKELGQLQYPKGIAIDKKGGIFVADSWNHRIQKFDSQGNPLLAFGSCGDGKGELNEPWDILIDSTGVLIVVERYNHRIQFFDFEGNSLGCIGQRGTTLEENLANLFETPFNLLAPPAFEFPTSIASDSYGNYFVTDSGNHRIRKFNKKWEEILTFGDQGDQPGKFLYPLSISIAPNDLLYIADLNNNRVQVFTSFGQFLDSIDQADLPLEAPCLTLVDSIGNLFVGLTFDTKILKYQTTLETESTLAGNFAACEPVQPEFINFFSLVQDKNNNQSKSFAALEQAMGIWVKQVPPENLTAPLRLGQRAFSGKEISKTSFDFALTLMESQLNESRKSMLAAFQAWQISALKFNEIEIKEQQEIQQDPQGLRPFNMELYTSEREDKKGFRETRNLYYSFRKSTQYLYDLIFHLIESNITEDQLKSITDLLSRQWKVNTENLNYYFNEKEKREESMVQILGDSGGEQLPAFLQQHYHNDRTLDFLIQLQFPLRAHCQVLNVLVRKAQENEKYVKFVRELSKPSVFSENAIRTMIRFHEHWHTLDILESLFFETMDFTQPYLDKSPKVQEPLIDDFSPVAFDSENLDMAQASKIFLAQSAEIKLESGILSIGPIKYKTAHLKDQLKELISKCLITLKAQSIFDDKYIELLDQLNELEGERRNLDANLRQIGSEDKATPISIQHNIAIMNFQLSLLRRMIKGIDINENLNLHRLVAGSAIVKVLNPEDSKLSEQIASYSRSLDDKIGETLKERKFRNFELIPLREQQKRLASSSDISSIDSSINVEASITEIKALVDRLEIALKKYTRTKGVIRQILKFLDVNPTIPETPLKPVFSISKVGSEIGMLFCPQGLIHNSKGDLLVVDHEHHQIHCFSQAGKFKFHFGKWGNTAENFKYPVNLATDSQDNIYVIDEGNGLIKKFDAMGNFILNFEEGILGQVFSLSVDGNDRIHIADPENNRISVFDKNGKKISLPFSAEQSNNLNSPCGIFCHNDGSTIIGDKSEFLLKHFDANGRLIHKIKREGLGFDEIYFITQDKEYGIFASDYWHNQIIHLSNDLQMVDIYRKSGNRIGELGKTGGLSIHKGRLAVSNFDGRKVQFFNLQK